MEVLAGSQLTIASIQNRAALGPGFPSVAGVAANIRLLLWPLLVGRVVQAALGPLIRQRWTRPEILQAEAAWLR